MRVFNFVLLVSILMAPGCVTRAKYLNDMEDTKVAARERCRAESAMKDARLRRFNQLNPDGSLR